MVECSSYVWSFELAPSFNMLNRGFGMCDGGGDLCDVSAMMLAAVVEVGAVVICMFLGWFFLQPV